MLGTDAVKARWYLLIKSMFKPFCQQRQNIGRPVASFFYTVVMSAFSSPLDMFKRQ